MNTYTARQMIAALDYLLNEHPQIGQIYHHLGLSNMTSENMNAMCTKAQQVGWIA